VSFDFFNRRKIRHRSAAAVRVLIAALDLVSALTVHRKSHFEITIPNVMNKGQI
jgi:hypothetical protein